MHHEIIDEAHPNIFRVVYGMGVDLATILAIMGTVWTGDVLSLDPSFSIGGPDTGVNNLLNNLGGVLGSNASLACKSPSLANTTCRQTSRPDWLAQLYRSRLIQHAGRSLRYGKQLDTEYGQVHGLV